MKKAIISKELAVLITRVIEAEMLSMIYIGDKYYNMPPRLKRVLRKCMVDIMVSIAADPNEILKDKLYLKGNTATANDITKTTRWVKESKHPTNKKVLKLWAWYDAEKLRDDIKIAKWYLGFNSKNKKRLAKEVKRIQIEYKKKWLSDPLIMRN